MSDHNERACTVCGSLLHHESVCPSKPDSRRRKTVEIVKCEDCPHYNFDDQRDPAKWGTHWCEKLDVKLSNNGEDIPKYCPLLDAP